MIIIILILCVSWYINCFPDYGVVAGIGGFQ